MKKVLVAEDEEDLKDVIEAVLAANGSTVDVAENGAQMLEKAEVKLNKRLFTGLEPYITISDLYDELNEQGVYPKLRHTAVSPKMGWTADAGGIEFDVDVDGVPFEQDHWEDGTPCYVMAFKRHREPDYIR